ncbi:NAD(P)-binding domain-containing protein [Maribacter sp. PR1]|uniref:NAD(P)-binding domain-containing protein n=1 Tax=Maribacter cobaltidurans TaxID=1178778 RepID=A0ABU7IQX5_9FLAO|nr:MULTISPECIES: NAD(P)-binding domain-containing protein [Maribacter]MDC6387983.1 NAD(P)-binding domain-containing protein [Maribacter sp. PR1]MEE1975372.1 NAD(P)-binding domain-containing protein [Maribacter cobaltidurans]
MNEVLLEQFIIYGTVFALCAITLFFYTRKKKKNYTKTKEKVKLAKIEGLFEPVSLHPFIDLKSCIGSGACITACPEKDILGIVDGVATVINTSNCIGHGACFHACPVEAISLRIGSETRGVDLPHVSEDYETNIKGMYIAGELGGMGLIKNSVEQGQMAVKSMLKSKKPSKEGVLDLVIIGAGPAGISASLAAKENNMTSITLEQDSLGGTVYTFPRSKIVMTAPMNLPLYGKVKLFDTNKDELLQIWKKVIAEHQLDVREHSKVDKIVPIENEVFKIVTNTGEEFLCNQVLLSIGRRGTPRKLGVTGEESQKVAYRLLEPELIKDKKVIVVGGGDSAIESAMLLVDANEVILSYRKDKFSRLKPKNRDKIQEAESNNIIKVIYNSNLVSIKDKSVLMTIDGGEPEEFENDLVYIFAGGELPTSFLESAGVKITKRFGHIMKSHK